MSNVAIILGDLLWEDLQGNTKEEAQKKLDYFQSQLKKELRDYEVALIRTANGPMEVLRMQRGTEERRVERLYGDSLRNMLMEFYQDEGGERSAMLDEWRGGVYVTFCEGPIGRRRELGERIHLEGKGRLEEAQRMACQWCGFGVEAMEVEGAEISLN